MDKIDLIQIKNLIDLLKNYPCNNELESIIEVLEELFEKLQNCKNKEISKQGEIQKVLKINADIKLICQAIELLEKALEVSDNCEIIDCASNALAKIIC